MARVGGEHLLLYRLWDASWGPQSIPGLSLGRHV